MTIRWRKEKPSGFSPPEIHILTDGKNDLARVQANGNGKFFWYARGKNTYQTPTNLETAKAEAKSYVVKTPLSKDSS